MLNRGKIMNCRRKQQHSRRNRRMMAGLCMGLIATAISTPALSQPDAQTQAAMIDAINDEYQARAFYTAVIEKFGNIRPFSNIVQAEDRHVQLWNRLFTLYGVAIPEDDLADKIEVPDTLVEACQMGVEAEIANVKMYDNFLSFVQEPDLKAAFTQLRQVSQNNHLPAFERCVANHGNLNPSRQERSFRHRGNRHR
jgi:hypothetical protein